MRTGRLRRRRHRDARDARNDEDSSDYTTHAGQLTRSLGAAHDFAAHQAASTLGSTALEECA